MVRKVPHKQAQKALPHWIILQISHLVAISFCATLLGKMLAVVRDMLDDIRVKAAWGSGGGTLGFITSLSPCFSLSFRYLSPSSCISPSSPSVIKSILNVFLKDL